MTGSDPQTGAPPTAPGPLGQLRQIQVSFDAENDRLLLRVNTSENVELRFWLTRRIVKRLWPILVRSLRANEETVMQPTPERREAVLAFQHEGAVASSDFTQRFAEKQAATPLGASPILATKVRLDRAGTAHRLAIHPAKGQGATLTLQEPILHSFCELLRRAVRVSDWDLALDALPPSAPTADPALRH